jgi:hypothetical protein
MNELIREVAKEAGLQPFEDCGPGYVYKMEKFAELIIAECVKHITDQQDLVETNWQCKDGVHIVYNLKEHFGVEE